MAPTPDSPGVRPQMRSADDARNFRKASSVFSRQAKECRERALVLLKRAESLESMSMLACDVRSEHEEYLWELAVRSNPAYQ